MTKAKFPRNITVTRESDGDGGFYLAVRETPENDTDIRETTDAARYSLVEVGKIAVARQFVLESA